MMDQHRTPGEGRAVTPPALDRDVFPESLRVVSFIPRRKLEVGILASPSHRAATAIFGALWTGFGAFLLASATVVPFVLTAIASAVVYWKFFTTWRMTFDFSRGRIKIATPGSIRWRTAPGPVTVTTRAEEGGWFGVAMVEGEAIAHSAFCQTEADARAALLPFARALNRELGIPLPAVGAPRETPGAGT
jgi:hypothetical protein